MPDSVPFSGQYASSPAIGVLQEFGKGLLSCGGFEPPTSSRVFLFNVQKLLTNFNTLTVCHEIIKVENHCSRSSLFLNVAVS